MIETSQNRAWTTKKNNATRDFRMDERFELPSEAGEPTRSTTQGPARMCTILAVVNKGARTTAEISQAVANAYRFRPSKSVILQCLKVATYYELLECRVQPLPQHKWRFIYIRPGSLFEGRYKPNLTLEECNERWVHTDATKLRKWWS